MAKAKLPVKANSKNRSKDLPMTYCFHCQAPTVTNPSEVVKLYKTGRLMRFGTCQDCGGSVAGVVKADTPWDRAQTKSEFEIAQAKKQNKKDAFLSKDKVDPKAKTKKNPVATTVKAKVSPTKVSQKKLVQVPKPVLKRRPGETKKAFESRVDRVWEKRKVEAVA